MAFVSITLLLLTSITLTFVHVEAVQYDPKYVTYQEIMRAINNVISLAPYSKRAVDSIKNRRISHFIASESPASSPGQLPWHSRLDGSNNDFDVRSAGAVGDGKTDDTKAFKAAWDLACNSTNQATLLVPKNHSFLLNHIAFEGPCQSSVTFQVDGNITAPEDPKPGNDSWLEFDRVDGLTMQGGGIIDGKGEHWWSCDQSCDRPVVRLSIL